MTDIMDIIKGRRSVRKFEDRPVPDEALQKLFEAVQYAPSWANTQVWEIVVVRDSAVKSRLQEAMAPKNPATRAIVEAPVVLAICGRSAASGYYDGKVTTKFGDWMLFDLGIATQNICLTAHEMGLGTVIVGLFFHDQAKEILAVPPGMELVALIPLGWPAKTPAAPKRRAISDFTHYDKF
jgi:nitroreductase